MADQILGPVVTTQDSGNHIVYDADTKSITDPTGAAAVRVASMVRQMRTRDKAYSTRPALIQAPLWATGTAYAVGDTVRLSTGQLIRCTTAGTSAGAAPAFSAINEMTDNTARWWFTGRYTQSPPAGRPVPTISDNSGFTALSTTFNLSVDTTKVLQIEVSGMDVIAGTGQDALNYGWTFKDSPANDNGAGANGHVSWFRAYRFRTDATVIDIPYIVSTSQDRFQVYIDEYPLWEAPPAPGATGTSRFVKLDWSSAPGSPRSYQVEGPSVSRKIGLTAGAVLYPERQDGVIGALITDSYGTTAVPTWVAGHSEYLGVSVLRKLGARYQLMYSLGGTGYVRSSGNRYKVADFLANNTFLTQPDFVMVPQSFNDIGISTPAVDTVAAAVPTWHRMRELFPNAFLVFCGPWPAADVAGALRVATDAALEAAFVSFADKRSGWISPITGKIILGDGMVTVASDGAWITGTGRQGATTGTGNSDWATSTDAAHPSPTGQQLLETRLTDSVETLLTKAGL